jgi:hypothetical protein
MNRISKVNSGTREVFLKIALSSKNYVIELKAERGLKTFFEMMPEAFADHVSHLARSSYRRMNYLMRGAYISPLDIGFLMIREKLSINWLSSVRAFSETIELERDNGRVWNEVSLVSRDSSSAILALSQSASLLYRTFDESGQSLFHYVRIEGVRSLIQSPFIGYLQRDVAVGEKIEAKAGILNFYSTPIACLAARELPEVRDHDVEVAGFNILANSLGAIAKE